MDTEKNCVITLNILKWRHALFVTCLWPFMQTYCNDIACDVTFDKNQCGQEIFISPLMQKEFSIIHGKKDTVILCRVRQNEYFCIHDQGIILFNMSNGDRKLFITINHSCMNETFKVDEAGEQAVDCNVSLEESEPKKPYNATFDTPTSGSTIGPDGNKCLEGSDGNATSPSCSPDKENNDVTVIPAAILGTLFVLITVLSLCIYFCRKKKGARHRHDKENGEQSDEMIVERAQVESTQIKTLLPIPLDLTAQCNDESLAQESLIPATVHMPDEEDNIC